MGNKEMNKELIIDWNKFKSNLKGRFLSKSRNSYIEFCEMLAELDFELVSDYFGSKERVELVYKLDSIVRLNPMKPNTFKTKTYKRIINFKNNLEQNKDEFIRFIGLRDENILIARFKTFDGGIVETDINNYNQWNIGRQDFYNKLKEVNGYTNEFYKNSETKMNIFIDDVKLNVCSHSFKRQTYKAILDFKNNLKLNNDDFVKFSRLSDSGNLVAKIQTFDGGVVDIDMSRYNSFNRGRQDFYDKLKEVNGCIDGFYKGADAKINICIDDIILNSMSLRIFKNQTYKSIIDFKNNLKDNYDEFIRFTGLTTGGNLMAQIKTFDRGKVDLDFSKYNYFNKARKDTYDYCSSKGYKILSPYVSSEEKILVDFSCGHNSHWITPTMLKNNQGCPICNESKGERIIRLYLEKNNMKFIQEYKFNDCKFKRSLPFDFYIPKYNLCIEFDGEQHYKAFEYFGGEESFKLTQIRDKIKNDYCKDNGINLLRIPYYEVDNINDILDMEFGKLRGFSNELEKVI